MTRRFYTLVLTILIFLLIYMPPLLSFNIQHALFAFSMMYILFANYGKISNDFLQIMKKYSIPLIALIIYILLIRFINSGDFFIDTSLFMLALETIPTIYVICDIKRKKNPQKNLFILIRNAALIQAIITLAAFAVPSIHDSIKEIYSNYGYSEMDTELFSHRMYGLSYGLTFGMPVVQSLIAILAFYRGTKKGWINYLISIILFVSAVINARTAIIVYGIGLLGILLSTISWSLSKALKVMCLITIILLVFTSSLSVIAEYNPMTAEWVEQGFEEIIGFLFESDNTGYFSYVSNVDRFKLPNNLDLILGIGERTMGGNSQGYYSDVGYINDIWYGGIIYCIAIMTYFISRYASVFKNYRQEGKKILIIKYFGIVLFLIVNIKGYFFSQNEATQLIMLISIFAYLESKHNCCKKNIKQQSIQLKE